MLAPILLDYRDELTADFQQYYQLDLNAMMDAGSFAAIATLTAQLPAQSRTFIRLHPELEWDENTYLLALIVDQLANISYGLGGGKGKKPKPIPRPKAKKKKKKTHLNVDKARIDALLFGARSPSIAKEVAEEGE